MFHLCTAVRQTVLTLTYSYQASCVDQHPSTSQCYLPFTLSPLHPQATLASWAAEVKPSSNPVVVGQTLVLAVSPATTVTGGSWSLGTTSIVNWVGSYADVIPGYADRASVDTATNSLTLRSFTLADAGVYTMKSTDASLTASITITALGETETFVCLCLVKVSLIARNIEAHRGRPGTDILRTPVPGNYILRA